MIDHAVGEADIANLFTPQVEASIARPDMHSRSLTEEEEACIVRASSARRSEFIRGRAALKQALHRLGGGVASIPSLPDRSPRLPVGFVASLSHCEGFCAAVAARAGDVEALGFDVERAVPLRADLEGLVRGGFDVGADESRLGPFWLTVLFSAKEAVYKCQHRLAALELGFSDVGVVFAEEGGPNEGRFCAVLKEGTGSALAQWPIAGSWRLQGGLVLTGAWSDR